MFEQSFLPFPPELIGRLWDELSELLELLSELLFGASLWGFSLEQNVGRVALREAITLASLFPQRRQSLGLTRRAT